MNRAQRGLDHPRTWECLLRLAEVYDAAGRTSEALTAFEELVKRLNADPGHGPDSAYTLGATYDLALAYLRADRANDALPLLEGCNKRIPVSPNLHASFPFILPTMGESVRAYRKAGRLPEACRVRTLLRECYRTLADVILRQPNHAKLAKAAAGFPEMFPERGEGCARAAGLLARCVTLAQRDEKLPVERRDQLARQYEDDALRLLRRAVDEGFSATDELRKASEFQSLRSRDAFEWALKGSDAGSK